MSNPLLTAQGLPTFSKIEAKHVVPAVEQLIKESRENIEKLVQQPQFTWENFTKSP